MESATRNVREEMQAVLNHLSAKIQSNYPLPQENLGEMTRKSELSCCQMFVRLLGPLLGGSSAVPPELESRLLTEGQIRDFADSLATEARHFQAQGCPTTLDSVPETREAILDMETSEFNSLNSCIRIQEENKDMAQAFGKLIAEVVARSLASLENVEGASSESLARNIGTECFRKVERSTGRWIAWSNQRLKALLQYELRKPALVAPAALVRAAAQDPALQMRIERFRKSMKAQKQLVRVVGLQRRLVQVLFALDVLNHLKKCQERASSEASSF